LTRKSCTLTGTLPARLTPFGRAKTYASPDPSLRSGQAPTAPNQTAGPLVRIAALSFYANHDFSLFQLQIIILKPDYFAQLDN
jgi:hypothetical protein